MRRRAVFASMLATVAGIAATFLAMGAVGAATNSTSTPVAVPCSSMGQSCDGTFRQTVTTNSLLVLEFESAWNSCANFSVSFYVDGGLVYSSPVLAPFERTGPVDAGPVASGSHQLEVRATGVTGGCDDGTLHSWGGRFLVTTGDAVPATPEPTPSDPDPVPPAEPTPLASPSSPDPCTKGGWKSFTAPAFKNQGQCMSYVRRLPPAATE